MAQRELDYGVLIIRMESQYLDSFMEEFFENFELYVQSARDLYQSPSPQKELDKIKDSIHALRSICMMLNIDNLTNFFQAFEEFLSRVSIKNNEIPYALNKALDLGYNKFREISNALENGKPLEKVSKLTQIETLVEVESFYSYAPN